MLRRAFLAGVIIVAVSIGLTVGFFLTAVPPDVPEDTPPTGNVGIPGYPVNDTRLDELAANTISGGPPPDGIPPIEDPIYWNVVEADEFLALSDIVFGLIWDGQAYAYPQRILVWHEIVNEKFDDERISISYCPLTGSCVAFRGTLGEHDVTFGTSGKLINSNLLMYDRSTNSYWPQITSQAITGTLKGTKLETYPTIWTSWDKWKAAYPDTLVLSTDTGFTRNYNRDPYGSYDNPVSYYYEGDPFFPIMNSDDRLSPKNVVIGIDLNGTQHAVEKWTVWNERIVSAQVGDTAVVLFFDDSLNHVRTFYREFDGQELTFRYEDGKILDEQTNTEWSVLGSSELGQLQAIDTMDVMWFGWSAFFPDTGLTCTVCG
ncbi:MAG: DUF3179 domain-containing protein [Candidatus Thorarchaeota archaeon]|jgi:hypothetical protein